MTTMSTKVPEAKRPHAAGPARHHSSPRLAAWIAPAVVSVVAAGALALFLLPLRGISLRAMNGLGLISVLPLASVAGLALLVACFVAMLALRRTYSVVLAVLLAALVFCLDGVTGLIEPLPRFATAYQVSGFVNYVTAHGGVAPHLAAYFSWPGFFALIAFVTGAAGVHSLLPLMTWWPVVIDLLLLLPFMMATRQLRISWRARWFAALLFSLGNWVGQDYFSPQSFNYLLYLIFIAIVLTWFSGWRRQRPDARRIAGELPSRQLATPQRAIMLSVLILIFVVSTLSHQLTPFLLLAACVGLVLAGRCTPRGLPIVLGVIVVGWISYGTIAYWSGHLSTIFGDLGQISGTISASVGKRVTGTDIHQLVDKSRIVLAALMAALAVAGLLRRWRGGISDRALAVLLVAPLSIIALQNYGGEISLRVYMFALPAASVLAACLFFPGFDRAGVDRASSGEPVRAPRRLRTTGLGLSGIIVNGSQAGTPAPASGLGIAALNAPTATSQRHQAQAGQARPHGATAVDLKGTADRFRRPVTAGLALVLAGVTAVGLSGLFLLTRYGNEAFEQTPAGEYAAMNYIYDHDHGGTSLLWISRPVGKNATPQMPWQFRDIGQVAFVAYPAPLKLTDTRGVVSALRDMGRGAFLITTRTEAIFISQTAGFPEHWEPKFRAALTASPALKLEFSNRDAAVYTARLPASAPRASAQAAAPGGQARSTIWSPIGLAAFALALLLLGSREFIRECAPARRRLLTPLALASLPVLALLVFAVAERFLVLA